MRENIVCSNDYLLSKYVLTYWLSEYEDFFIDSTN